MENCDNCKQPPHKCIDCFKWSNWKPKEFMRVEDDNQVNYE